MSCFLFIFADKPITSALVCHFVGIAGLYLLRGTINLISSPAGCILGRKEKLTGLDMGSYLKKELKTQNDNQKDDVEENDVSVEITEIDN